MGRLEELSGELKLPPEGRYLIGVSGGADSVALLRMLAGRFPLEAVHVNHGLRGADSDGDENFVRELCGKLRIPLWCARARLNGRRDENAAREARFRCFRERMAQTGSDGLILAHNRDDVAETFLMRLLRGAGPDGLQCMRPEEVSLGVRIYRPMLGIRRKAVREALRAEGQPWREDGSNGDESYLRNAVRLRLIPEMERLAPGAGDRIARTAELIAADNQALRAEARAALEACSGGRWLRTDPVRALPAGLQRRVLRQWWADQAPPLDERALSADQTEALRRLLEGGAPVNLPGGLTAKRGRRHLHLTGFPETEAAPVPWRQPEVRLGNMTLEARAPEGNPGDGRLAQEMPADFPEGCVVRTRRPGDRIRPFGAPGSRKLQDYLTDRHVDAPWRDQIPLLCRGQEVLLVAGIGAGDVPRWNRTARNIRLTWRGPMPWSETGEE